MMENDVILVIQDYKIVEKESTIVVKRTIEECKQIFWTWTILSESTQKQTAELFNQEILAKLNKCYKYYQRKYDVEIENDYGVEKDIEINLSNICEKIRSWEEE